MKYDFCIVGAGPSGLTLAYKLLQKNKHVVLVERDSRVGGLAKSYDYDGHIFDTGPKRFHTDDPVVLSFINEIMSMSSIGRSTMVYFLNQYYTWPLKSTEFHKMPVHVAFKAFVDLLRKRPILDRGSFRDLVVSKYGKTLYETFFKPYTHKFLRWDVEDIHSDWASTGINRTVIDKRVHANSLLDLFSSIILPQKIETEFLYPLKGGFGAFYDRLHALCAENQHFTLLLGNTLLSLTDDGSCFHAKTSDTSEIMFETLVWSGNVKDLCRLISPVEHDLHYLNTIFYNFVCRESGVGNRNRVQWIYISRGDWLTSRITCMKEFSPHNVPGGYYNFICELTDSQSQPVYFKDPAAYQDKLINELLDMRFLKTRRAIESVFINPVRDTYPIYHRRYHRDFAQMSKTVKRFSERIHLLGRSGAYWYNNSDHSIRMALDMSHKLLGNNEVDFDHRGYFGGTFREDLEHNR